MKTLSFDPEEHVYTLIGDNGGTQVLPSVTEIASVVTGKSMAGIPESILAKARDRGIKIHTDIETGAFQTEEGRWAKQFIDWSGCRFEGMEYAEIDGLVYAGRYDTVCGDRLIDLKTQAEPDILFWTVQLNLYANFYSDRLALEVLWMPKNQDYERVFIQTLSAEKMADIVKAYKRGEKLPDDWLYGEPKEAGMDLVIYNQTIGSITTNAKAILQTVKAQVAHYKAENYTEENIGEAKRDKADLNAAAKKLNDKRIELEREYAKPLAEFKDTIAEAVGVIKTASGLIDGVVKEVENRAKAEKRKILEEAWAALECHLFPLAQIWRDEWVNKGSKTKETVAEMSSMIEKAKADLAVLDRIGEPEAKAYYLDTLSLEKSLEVADRIKANRERLQTAEREKAESRERLAKLESVVKEALEPDAPVELYFKTKTEPPVKLYFKTKTEPEEVLVRVMRVKGTRDQLLALGRWMNETGVDFEKLEGGSV